jgi:hypothetical protein
MKKKTAKQPKESKPAAHVKDLKPKKNPKAGATTKPTRAFQNYGVVTPTTWRSAPMLVGVRRLSKRLHLQFEQRSLQAFRHETKVLYRPDRQGLKIAKYYEDKDP